LWIERVGKARTPAAHLDVRLPGERAHGCRDIGDRGAVDQMHGVAECHAERYTDD